MDNQQMITAILNAIQTETNMQILLQLVIANNIGNASTVQLQAMCKSLGITFT